MATAMPGGPADKAGNRYEHWWTVLRIADLLDGKGSRLRLEPLGASGAGIEFEFVDNEGVLWGEQVKHGSRTWTVNRLRRDGVLAAAKYQVELGRKYRFVALDTVGTKLQTLADRARQSESLNQFQSALSQELQRELDQLREAWCATGEEAWGLLRCVVVEHHTTDSLRLITEASWRRLCVGEPDRVMSDLRTLCDERIHTDLTAREVWDHLNSKGFERRLIVGDRNVGDALHATVERQRRRVDSTQPGFGLAARRDADLVVEKLRDYAGPQIFVVDGRAGCGKSTVVSQVASSLETDGWHVAIARMDIDTSLPTSDHMGQAIGLSDSPTVLLAGIANDGPALMIVDQLDAVSMYSGRLADSLDSVDEIATEIQPTRNLRLLLVVRTADLESDPRLSRLLNSGGDIGRHTVGRLEVEAVTELLEANGVRAPDSELTLDLLRTPLHLSVFSRLSEDARRSDYSTLQELYEAYTQEARARVERRVGHLDWEGITDPLVSYMSDNQTLAAPQSALDAASRHEVEALVSESVLARDGSQLAFFHESFFDFLFARSFVSTGEDLREFLLRKGQWLFRRAQVRQVLDYRLVTERQRFYEIVVDLLCCDTIRSHIKALVIDLLRRVPAELTDWSSLEEFAWDDTWISRRLVRLLSQPAWFDAADTLGLWETWLDDPLRAERACAVLTVAAKERPSRAVELLRPRINESEEWPARLASLVSFSMSSELVDFTIELIDQGILDDLSLPMSGRRDVWWLIYPIKRDDPVGTARVVGSILRRGLARARAEGSGDPFESDHLSTSSQMASTIREVAHNAPHTFVQEVLPFVRAVAFAGQQPREHHLPTGRRWAFRHVSANHSVDDIVFNAIESALRRLAIDEPVECTRLIAPLLDAESEELRFLACRALAALDDPDGAVAWLLSDYRNLALGWSDSALWASREVIEVHSPNCTSELFSALECTVLDYAPAWEVDNLRLRGRDKYELLSAMDSQRLSHAASAVLRELQRKFPGVPPQPPTPIAVSSVGSPIPATATEHMTDDDWLRALTKHTGMETNWNTSSGQPMGGARQLAQQLGQEAEAQPGRFARLAMRFDATVPATAMNAVLEGVASGCSADVLAELCGHARDTYGEASGMSVCRAIAGASVTDARLVALLRDCAADADPDHESARTLAPSGQQYWGGDLLNAGLNSTRGQAALAIAKRPRG